MENNENNEIGLAVGDQLLRRQNGRVLLVTVHRVTRTRAYVNIPIFRGTEVYEEPIYISSGLLYNYPYLPRGNNARYEIATPEKIAQYNDAARRAELAEKIKSYPLEKLTTQSLENILKILPHEPTTI